MDPLLQIHCLHLANSNRSDGIITQITTEAERRGIELLGEIPLSLEVRTGGDSGTPVVVASPRSEQAKTYRSIARRLMEVADLRKVDEEEEES